MSRALQWTQSARIVALVGLVGCTPLSTESMMPGSVERAAQPGGRTLHVAPVVGGEGEFHFFMGSERIYYVGNEQLQAALGDALDESRLFRSVASDGPGDFELSTRIVSQDCQPASESGYLHCVLVVNYRLREVATARDAWSDTLVTRGHATGGPEGTAAANRKALSAAAQRSLTEMLRKLSEALP